MERQEKAKALRLFFEVLLAVAVLLLLLQVRERGSEEMPRVWKVSDGRTISFKEMISEVKSTNLVFVGELHDSEADHRIELDVIKALHDRDVPLAVGFEMFTSESQGALDRWVDGGLDREKFIRIYYRDWGMPWPLYRDILLYVREKNIPALGLNVPPAIARKVNADGFSSLSSKELAMLPPGITCSVDRQYMEFIRKAYRAHDIPGGRFINFCEAQQLWNKTMAWHLVGYLKKHPDKVVVVLTGTGHAWKMAVPAQVTELSKTTSYKVILPEIPGYIDPKSITTADADYIVLRD